LFVARHDPFGPVSLLETNGWGGDGPEGRQEI
jgi:hypothetical protein